MYATTTMLRDRPAAAHPRGWWLALLIALASICAAAMAPRVSTVFKAAPPILPISAVAKAAGPLSARLAKLARIDRTPADRAATMRALSLPDQGPGSLLADAAGDPLVYIYLARVDPGVSAAVSAAGARIVHSSDRYGVLTAAVAPHRLAAVAAVPGVVGLQEALAPSVPRRRRRAGSRRRSRGRTHRTSARPARSSLRATGSCVPPRPARSSV
jgi:hypothetical protein